MWCSVIIIYGLLVYQGYATKVETCSQTATGSPNFPENFNFGVTTSAYQIEGSWNEDGKGPSIWDDFTHEHQDMIDDKTNGDIVADSYHRFDQDLEALKELKINFYRFSISWSRIFPTGDIISRNQKGIDYYNDIIDKLLANNIEPMVTLFHFDLPTKIQKKGGFINSLIIDQFDAYANEIFKIFGDRVKTWITFNEPLLYCTSSYGDGIYPPLIRKPGVADYKCIDNTLKAHAVAYHTYKVKFYKKQKGKIGIAIQANFFFSETNYTDLVQRGLDFSLGFQAQPIFGETGGYPDLIVSDIAKNSLNEGLNVTRFPQFNEKWRELIKGSADFLGLNYYTSKFIKQASKPQGKNPSLEHDQDYEEITNSKWTKSISPWLYCVPEGLEGLLKYIRDEYKNVEVIILENGWSDDGGLEDNGRINYIKSHLQAVLNAINDGCNVTGYSYWSLMDTFEWLRGFTIRFGLYSINLLSNEKERIPRKSAEFYRNIINSRTIRA